jgi:hypothetical protein
VLSLTDLTACKILVSVANKKVYGILNRITGFTNKYIEQRGYKDRSLRSAREHLKEVTGARNTDNRIMVSYVSVHPVNVII